MYKELYIWNIIIIITINYKLKKKRYIIYIHINYTLIEKKLLIFEGKNY